MKRDEFNKAEFRKGMQIIVDGKKVHDLIGVDFELMLMGVNVDNSLDLTWIDAWRCKIIKDKSK